LTDVFSYDYTLNFKAKKIKKNVLDFTLVFFLPPTGWVSLCQACWCAKMQAFCNQTQHKQNSSRFISIISMIHHFSAIYERSCEAFRKTGSQSSVFTIDLDGSGPLEHTQVNCTMAGEWSNYAYPALHISRCIIHWCSSCLTLFNDEAQTSALLIYKPYSVQGQVWPQHVWRTAWRNHTSH